MATARTTNLSPANRPRARQCTGDLAPRRYTRHAGVLRPVTAADGSGRQIGGRFDWLDLNSKGISGGRSSNFTLGVNWFLNANARIQLNYLFSEVDNAGFYAQGPLGSLVGSRFSGNGLVQSVGTRLDFNF